MEKVILKTSDNKSITANYFKADKEIGWIVFLHMMPATKESWDDLAEYFRERGYSSIAIDLRGHGESEDGPRGYFDFSEEEHQKSIYDVDIAAKFLIEKGANPAEIILMGASIGANLALQYLVEKNLVAAILFSPGLDYHEIVAENYIKMIKDNHKLMIISAKDDKNVLGNYIEAQEIFSKLPEIKKEIFIYDSGGHGTDILKSQPQLKELIKEFIAK